ncbi:MAG: hypothetical protein P1V97_37280, partial [Planctomycetota bacterium]|nr:hypothetical protein [Planctomycetota bacterium]
MSRLKKLLVGACLSTLLALTLSVIYLPRVQAPLLSSLLILGKKDQRVWAVKRLATLGESGLGGLAFALDSEDPEVQ